MMVMCVSVVSFLASCQSMTRYCVCVEAPCPAVSWCCVVTDFLELCGQVTSEMSVLTALVQNPCEATVPLHLVCWGPGLGPALWAWEDCEHLQGKMLPPPTASSPVSKETLSSAGPAPHILLKEQNLSVSSLLV